MVAATLRLVAPELKRAFVFAVIIGTLAAVSPECVAQKSRGDKERALLKEPPKNGAAPLKVAKVDPSSLDRVRIAADRIDALVAASHAHYQVQPNSLTTDEQFVRRIYLDITGTIPNYEQTVEFIDSREENKRTKLIDRLLNSPGYVSHHFNYWANILRLTDRPSPNIFAMPYLDWVKQSIAENQPYDKWVEAMLTAEGKVWENPAAGYTLRDEGMPLDHMDNTMRVFLGTRIGCAQCHDHPFDKWTQQDFYQIAAFYSGVTTRISRKDPRMKMGNPYNRLKPQLDKARATNKNIGVAIQLLRANSYSLEENPKRPLRFPHDYAYDNGKPGDIVTPEVLFGEMPDLATFGSRRTAFASWLISKENPRFAPMIANRLWAKAMGRGIVEPIDDIRDDSDIENPALLVYLASIMRATNFDLKEYLRIVYNSKTYQRQSSPVASAGDEHPHFPGPELRRMTAEQAWDSFLTLAVYAPDDRRRPSAKDMKDVADVNLAKVTFDEIVKRGTDFNEQFGNVALRQLRNENSYKGQMLLRASEQPIPLPPGHFLRQFGQGDRELIEGDSTQGTVPQILTMFNGPVTHMMLEKGSVIFDTVVAQKSMPDQIDAIFLTVLSRRPTTGERSLAMREMNTNKAAGYGNVIWALVNTREFLFVQ